MNKMKFFLTSALLSLIPISYIKAGDIKFNKLFKTKKDMPVFSNKPSDIPDDVYKTNLLYNLNWLKNSEHQELNFTSYDGLRISATKITNHHNHKLVILLHGANQDRYGVLNQARIFDSLGYDTLLVDQRGHGKSEGEYTSHGFKEAIDLAMIVKKLCDEDNSIEIGLYGISIGANATMMYLKNATKDNIKFAIEEGGFTSGYDNLFSRFDNTLLFLAINHKYKKIMDVELSELDCVEALKYNDVPILFLHSLNDEVVSSDNANELYEANRGYKVLHMFEASTHMGNNLSEEYPKVIENFISSLK